MKQKPSQSSKLELRLNLAKIRYLVLFSLGGWMGGNNPIQGLLSSHLNLQTETELRGAIIKKTEKFGKNSLMGGGVNF